MYYYAFFPASAHQLYRILKENSDLILKFVLVLDKKEGSEKQKTMKKSNFKDVEKTLYVRFLVGLGTLNCFTELEKLKYKENNYRHGV